jgi:hypothetical protein
MSLPSGLLHLHHTGYLIEAGEFSKLQLRMGKSRSGLVGRRLPSAIVCITRL